VRPAARLTMVCVLGCVAHAPAQNTSSAAGNSAAEKLIKDSDCSSCHAADRDIVGPAYSDMAKRYAGQADAVGKISAKIRDGGGGMTPHPDMSEAQRNQIAQWILGQKDSTAPAAAPGHTYNYTGKDGSPVELDFPLFLEGQTSKVTKDVFHGYQLWNSYCYRCHGTDATGGQLAPDLRRSLTAMKQQEFIAVTMEGRKEKGMPSWAGFLSPDDVLHIYKYAKGRSLELVPTGRPPSAQD
jgi:cytochrome c